MTALAQKLTKLPFEEKLQLVWDLWDSIAAEKTKIPVSETDAIELEILVDEYLRDGDKGETWEVVRKSISKKK